MTTNSTQAFKNIDNILRKDAGCGSELDYVEQSSWILFLKYLADLEQNKKIEAQLRNENYQPIIAGDFEWEHWAAPKNQTGKPDFNHSLTGDDLIDFVNNKLFPYLKDFKKQAASPNTLEYKIGEIFSELKNRLTSGYNLREILWLVDGLKFQTSEEKHEMSELYENRINKMGNAGRNGGEYYTPRPLIRTIVKIVNPEIGKTIYDGACGSAGFLCEAFAYLSQKITSTHDREVLQTKTFYGKEKKGLAYIIGVMNLILHGLEAPNILHTNTLGENLAEVQEKDRFDYILANPPFGGKERSEIKQNFPIQTSETAYLFLQHFIRYLRVGGRAGIVIKNTFLNNGNHAVITLRRKLLEDCNLTTILDLPSGVFTAGVKTVVLFFEKGTPTTKIKFYQLNLDRNLGKTNPLNEKDLAEFENFVHDQPISSHNGWEINITDLDQRTLDLSVKNPHQPKTIALESPTKILQNIKQLNQKNETILRELEEMFA